MKYEWVLYARYTACIHFIVVEVAVLSVFYHFILTAAEAYEEYGSPVKLEVALGALKREVLPKLLTYADDYQKKVTWDTFQPASELRDVQEVRLVG